MLQFMYKVSYRLFLNQKYFLIVRPVIARISIILTSLANQNIYSAY